MKCPNCGAQCEAEHVDIGVGEQRIEPWSCPACRWVETNDDLGLYDSAGFDDDFL